MTTPATGISFLDVNKELALSNTNSTTINDGGVRALAGFSGTGSGTQISFSDLASKSGRKYLRVNFANSSTSSACTTFVPIYGSPAQKSFSPAVGNGSVVTIQTVTQPYNLTSAQPTYIQPFTFQSSFFHNPLQGTGGTHKVYTISNFTFNHYRASNNGVWTATADWGQNGGATYIRSVGWSTAAVNVPQVSNSFFIVNLVAVANTTQGAYFVNTTGYVISKLYANGDVESCKFYSPKSTFPNGSQTVSTTDWLHPYSYYAYNANTLVITSIMTSGPNTYYTGAGYAYKFNSTLGSNTSGNTVLIGYSYDITNPPAPANYYGTGQLLTFVPSSGSPTTLMWGRGYVSGDTTTAIMSSNYSFRTVAVLANTMVLALQDTSWEAFNNYQDSRCLAFFIGRFNSNGVIQSSKGYTWPKPNTAMLSDSSDGYANGNFHELKNTLFNLDTGEGYMFFNGRFNYGSNANSVAFTNGEYGAVDQEGYFLIQKLYANGDPEYARMYYNSTTGPGDYPIGKGYYRWSCKLKFKKALGVTNNYIYVACSAWEANNYAYGTTTPLSTTATPTEAQQNHMHNDLIMALHAGNGQIAWARAYTGSDWYNEYGAGHELVTSQSGPTFTNVIEHPYANNLAMIVSQYDAVTTTVLGINIPTDANTYSNRAAVNSTVYSPTNYGVDTVIVKKSDGNLVSTAGAPALFTVSVAPQTNSVFHMPTNPGLQGNTSANNYLVWLNVNDTFDIFRVDPSDVYYNLSQRFPRIKKSASGFRINVVPCPVSSVNAAPSYWNTTNTQYSAWFSYANSNISVTVQTYTADSSHVRSNTSISV